MLRSNHAPQLGAIALLLALAGCDLDKMDLVGGVEPPTAAASEPPGQEIFRMFDAEKSNAAPGELPAQF